MKLDDPKRAGIGTASNPNCAAAFTHTRAEIAYACAATILRMLRQEPAASGNGRAHLHIRMYLLPRLCRQQAWRALPQLRGQPCHPSHPSGGQAWEISRVDRTGFQSGGMRQRSLTVTGVNPTTLRPALL